MTIATHSTDSIVTDESLGAAELKPGTPVEVRRRFDRQWAQGFVIESATGGGYTLRRNSDGSILPVPFPAADLRPTVSH